MGENLFTENAKNIFKKNERLKKLNLQRIQLQSNVVDMESHSSGLILSGKLFHCLAAG